MRNISQSLIKCFQDWKARIECGDVLKAKYIDHTWVDDPIDAMKLGTYFEFLLTGQLPRSGKIPEPERTQKGTLKAPYKRVEEMAERVRELMKKSGIKVLETGRKLSKNGMVGIEDVHASYKGRNITIDTKYSGLLDDKWNRMGWVMTPEQKAYHGIQAKQYHIITGKPFYYLVASSKNTTDVKFFEVEIDGFAKEQHIKLVDYVRESIDFLLDIDGFTNYPELSKCEKCQLTKCKDRQTELKPELIKLNE